jgi:hypothetical protein
MKINRSSMRIAATVALSFFSATTVILNAQSPNLLTGKIPVPFHFDKKTSAPAGEYDLSVLRPGVVMIRAKAGDGKGITMLPVQTSYTTNRATLTLRREDSGTYRLSGFCAPGAGCWSTSEPARTSSKTIEIALMSPYQR